MTCHHCGGKWSLSGPYFGGELHDRSFVSEVRQEVERLVTSGAAGGFPLEQRPASMLPRDAAGNVEAAAAAEAAAALAAEARAAAEATAAAAGAGAAAAEAEALPAPACIGPEALQRVQRGQGKDAGSNTEATVQDSRKRLLGLLRLVEHEAPGAWLYRDLAAMTSRLRLSRMLSQERVLVALDRLGYKSSAVHDCKNGLRTTAPQSVLWDVLRAFEKEEAPSNARAEEAVLAAKQHQQQAEAGQAEEETAAGGAGRKRSKKEKKQEAVRHHMQLAIDLLNRSAGTAGIDLSAPSAEERGRGALGDLIALRAAGPRFAANPGEEWGPKHRAKTVGAGEHARLEGAGAPQAKRQRQDE